MSEGGRAERSIQKLGPFLAGAVVGTATSLFPGGTGLGLLGAAFAWLCATSLALGASLLVASRSSFDFLTDTGIPIGAVRINPPGAIGLVVLVLSGFYLMDRRLRRRAIDWGGGPALAFALLALFALLQTPNAVGAVGPKMLSIGLKETLRLGSLLGLYLLLVNLLRSGADRRLLLRSVYASLLVPGALGIGQFFLYSGQGFYDLAFGAEQHGRLTGSFFHPNTFGIYLAFLLTLSFTLLRHPESGLPPWILIPVMGLTSFLLVFTASRTAFVFLGVCLGLKLLFRPRRALLPLLLGLLALVGFFGPRIAARFSDVASDVSLRRVVARRELRNSFEWRIYNWYVLSQTGLERPWIGHGTSSTSHVNPLQSVNRQTGESRGFSAHNEFVRFFVEGGFLGLAVLSAFYILLIGWAWRLFHRWRRAGRIETDLAGMALEIPAGVFVIGLFAANPLDQTSVLYYFLTFFALIRSLEERSPVRILRERSAATSDLPASTALCLAKLPRRTAGSTPPSPPFARLVSAGISAVSTRASRIMRSRRPAG